MPHTIYLAGICTTTGRRLVQIEYLIVPTAQVAEDIIEALNTDVVKMISTPHLAGVMLNLKAFFGPQCEITFVFMKEPG